MSDFICPPDHLHGLNNVCYRSHRCRCADCRALNAEVKAQYQRELRLAKTPLTAERDQTVVSSRGFRRRVEALMLRGWTGERIAKEMGLPDEYLTKLFQQETISFEAHAAMKVTFSYLWNRDLNLRTEYERRESEKIIEFAKRGNFVPGLAWDDIDHDERPPVVAKASPQEKSQLRLEEIQFLLSMGMSEDQICKELGITKTSVSRFLWQQGQNTLAKRFHWSAS